MAEIICMPKFGSTMETGILSSWIKAVGDTVKKGESICDIETEKLVTAVECMTEGVMLAHIGEVGEEYAVGAPICIIGQAGESIDGLLDNGAQTAKNESEQPPAAKAESPEVLQAAEKTRVKISPLAKRIAEENGLDYTAIKGSGEGGRIEKKDVLEAIENSKKQSVDDAAKATKTVEPGEDTVERMSGMRKTIAARMFESKSTIPHTYFKTDVDMTDLMEFRVRAAEAIEGPGKKYGVNELILKAAALTLRQVDGVNVSINGNEIITHKHINLGMAVSVPNGLVVPVIKDADMLSVPAIGRAAAELAEKARNGSLSMDDMSGGTFTVSSLGRFGIPEFTAIINPPNAAILAVGAVRDEVWPVKGQVAIRKILHATLSIDHRVIDGALAAQYLAKFKDLLENPYLLLV
jgi:pyruvate dehydrogenase E2 component (dihydrolipoamide acetyltransferase)